MRLRPVRRDDQARIQELVEDPEVRAPTNMPDPYPADGAARWLDTADEEWATGTGFAFAIVTDDGLVGVCAVHRVGGEPLSGELGYWIGRPFWGRGLASEAVRQVVAYSFAERGLGFLTAACLEDNRGSVRVLEKNGFRLERHAPQDHPKWAPNRLFAWYRLDRPAE